MRRTRGSYIPRTSQDEDGILDPPPVPTNLADAITALVNVTAENSRLLHEIAQSNQNQMHGNRGRHHNRQEATYVDFTDTRPPVFTKADEPLEADDWLRTMEQKFDLIPCTEYQKPAFAAQQLRGAASAWWANLVAMQPAGIPITWAEFRTAFRAHYIPEGVMAMKLDEFLALKQGDQTVMQYVGRFNHLSQYASEHVNTDAKKKRWFMRGLNTKLQTMMTTCTNVTYHEAVNIAIALESKYR